MKDLLPAGWLSTSLKEITEKIGSGATPKGGESSYKPEGTPLIRSKNIIFFGFKNEGLAFIDEEQARALDNATIRARDVLLNITGASIGRVSVAPDWAEDARVNQHVCIVRPHHSIAPEYISAYLSSPDIQGMIEEENYGVTRQALTKKQVEDIAVPIPPLNEQRRIADKLDTTLAAVEACKQKLNNASETIQRFRQSVLAAAVSGELTREWREERGIEEEWETFTLSEICETISDGDHQAPPKAEQGIPFITISAINEAELDLEKATRFVPESYFQALSPKRRACRRDVLFSVTGSIAIPALVKTDKKFVFQRHIALLRSDNHKILPEYLYYHLLSNEVKEKCYKNATGTAQLTIPLKVLRNIQIKLPSIDEQKEIVSRVDDLYSSATKIEFSIEQATQKTNSSIPSLLAKAFRGELVPQDPNDEPASVLLERIKAQREAESSTKKPAKRGRKKKADASQLVIPAGIAENRLAMVLEECGALSELALIAASELEPEVFQLQLSKELKAGGLKLVDLDGEAAYADAAWEEA